MRFADADVGGLIIHARLNETVLNRSAMAISVNRRCRWRFGRFALTLDLRLFQHNRSLADTETARRVTVSFSRDRTFEGADATLLE
jgi:hypothetical protein